MPLAMQQQYGKLPDGLSERGVRREEIVSLTWAQVNLFDRTVTLDPGPAKNNEARLLCPTGELLV